MVLWSACSGPLTATGWSSAALSAGPASLITITSPYAVALYPPFSQVERVLPHGLDDDVGSDELPSHNRSDRKSELSALAAMCSLATRPTSPKRGGLRALDRR